MTKDIAIGADVPLLGADRFDPLEDGIRQRIHSFIIPETGRHQAVARAVPFYGGVSGASELGDELRLAGWGDFR